MKVGFIGAGKAGCSVGRYFREQGVEVMGYYSRTDRSALDAAEFTNTQQYTQMNPLVLDCDVVFLSVPDDAIPSVWEELQTLPIQDKIISHLSGCISSKVFGGIAKCGAYGCSVHPLFAISSRFESYKELSQAFFTIEGEKIVVDKIRPLMENIGNDYAVISPEDKVKYHAAAVMVSNLSVGLAYTGEKLLQQCGFSKEMAHKALIPLLLGNVRNIVEQGTIQALTGPIERDDVDTVRGHLGVLDSLEGNIYRVLSKQVVEIAKEKHKDRDYKKMGDILS